MKLFCVVLILSVAFSGCTKSSPVMTPIQAAGCAVESAITGGFGAEVVKECGGTDAVACGGAFQTALGNVNLCAQPLPQQASLVKDAAPGYKTIGDVPEGALKNGKIKVQAVKAMGIVGAIACPMAINTGLGLLTGAIPPACGCTKNLSASALAAMLESICVAAVPI